MLNDAAVRGVAVLLGLAFIAIVIFLAIVDDSPRNAEAYIGGGIMAFVGIVCIAVGITLRGERLRGAVAAILLGIPVAAWLFSRFSRG